MRAIDKAFDLSRARGTVILWGCVLAGVALFHITPLRERLDNAALDAIQRLVRAAAPRPAVENVVIVGIDEETERRFPEPLALWHRHLGEALVAMASANPKLIALDIVLPERSYDSLVPGLDAELVRGLVAAKHAGGLVLGLRLDGQGKPQVVNSLLLAAAGREAMGLAYVTVDRDNTARRLKPVRTTHDAKLPLLAQRVASAMGLQSRDGIIDFACGKSFSYFPMHDVISWAREQPSRLSTMLEGKVVLLGKVGPDDDPVRQPLSLADWAPNAAAPPGVVLIAQTVRALESGRILTELSQPALAALVGLSASVVLVGGLWRTWTAAGLMTAGIAALVYWAYLSGIFAPPTSALAAVGLAGTVRSIIEGVEQRRARLAVERQFGGYVSQNLLEAILKREVDPTQPRKYTNLAFLFADLRGFTTLTEKLPAAEVLALLNRYYEAVIPAIHSFDGTIDNFRGDGILAIFGAPRPADDAPRRAVLAARDMFVCLQTLNVELTKEGHTELNIGVGIAAGDAVVGNVGTSTRHGYSAVGDAVNVSARLQSFCKPLKMQIVASEAIAQAYGDLLSFVPLGRLELAGHAPVNAFGVANASEKVTYYGGEKSVGENRSYM